VAMLVVRSRGCEWARVRYTAAGGERMSMLVLRSSGWWQARRGCAAGEKSTVSWVTVSSPGGSYHLYYTRPGEHGHVRVWQVWMRQ
jgi:hypothetical protein